VSAAWLKTTGTSYGTDESRKANKVSPYIGLLYDITKNVTAYASYTSIFNPQTEVDINNRKLAPAQGDAWEGGFKSQWFDDRLYASASVFRAKQSNLATYAGDFGPGDSGPIGGSYYAGETTTSTGFQIDAAGRITDNWTLNGGLSVFKLRADDHTDPSPYIPNQTLKLGSTYSFPQLNNFKLGAQMRWQGRIHYDDYGVATSAGGPGVVRQGSYAVIDLMSSIDIVDNLRATLNLRNLTDKKYLTSLLWGQAFYAEPRAVTVSLSYKY
jgi:outer membrane receptor for ferric coprogen and ferric-rhodotorulic acid